MNYGGCRDNGGYLDGWCSDGGTYGFGSEQLETMIPDMSPFIAIRVNRPGATHRALRSEMAKAKWRVAR